MRDTGSVAHQLFDGHPLSMHVLGQPPCDRIAEGESLLASSRDATMIVSGFVIDATLVGVAGVKGTRSS